MYAQSELGLVERTRALLANPPDPYKYEKQDEGQRLIKTSTPPITTTLPQSNIGADIRVERTECGALVLSRKVEKIHIPETLHEDFSCRDLIYMYMPTFAWVTFGDLLTMLEFVAPDIEVNTLSVTLCKMHKQGLILSKKWTHPTRPNDRGPTPMLYMRKS